MKEIFTTSKQPAAKVDRSGFGLDRLSGMITFVILINQFKEQQLQQEPTSQLICQFKNRLQKT